MDYHAQLQHEILTAGSASREPVPRKGQNRVFDEHVVTHWGGDIEDPETEQELRRAAWATWKTGPPRIPSPRATLDDEDAELARAIALSTRDAAGGPSNTRPLPADDEDEELQRILKMSEEEARAPKRQKREETPEEERKQLEEALKASMAGSSDSDLGSHSLAEIEVEKANEEYQKSREAFREEERRKRAEKALDRVTSGALPTPPPTSSSQNTTMRSTSTSSTSGGGTTRAVSATASSSLPLFQNREYVDRNILNERAQMEKERLARQAARTVSGTQGGRIPSSSSSINGLANSNGSTRSINATAGPSRFPDHPLQSTGPFPEDAAGEYYLDGELRHSRLEIGEATTTNTFEPKDMFGRRSQISLLILSSYVLDDEWMREVLPDPMETPTIMIRPYPHDHPDWGGRVQAQPSGEVYCFPKMVGEYGSAHMKFAWIFYKTGRLRVVISTANMVPYDWDWIENTTFIQDFLLLKEPIKFQDNHLPHDFPQQFRHLFGHLKVHKALRWMTDNHPKGSGIPFQAENGFQSMEKYDWSRITIRLIMSIPGQYDGLENMSGFGLCRLGDILYVDGLKSCLGEKVSVEYQGSSLGAYTIDWFDQFYQMCQGKTVRSLLGRAKPSGWPFVKVLFPSLETVDKSILGRAGGGTMFAGSAWKAVTKHLFHDANSKRGGVLMHSKMIIALFEPQDRTLGFQPTASPVKNGNGNGKRKADEMENDDPTTGESKKDIGGWVYVGSHNFSSAAWGTLNLKKSPPSMTIRNYELGFVFPLPRKNAREVANRIAPYKRPSRPYSPTDEPWDQKKFPAPAQE